MKEIKIKSKKQDNGIWGMPLNCVKIENFSIISDYNNLKFSAIIMAITEQYNKKFEIWRISDTGFTINLDSPIFSENYSGTLYTMKFSNYEVVDDILYEFQNEQEHTNFLRKYKIKNLENV